MSDSLRYKIVLWLVWVQLALLPIIYMMLAVTNNGLIWRWNLVNWLMVGGYILGLLALPLGRGLEKPKLLKWWLRMDFWTSLILAVIVLPLLNAARHHVYADDGDFVLYREGTCIMATAPYYHIGMKDGIFIRELPYKIGLYNHGHPRIDCFKVDTMKGFSYGLDLGSSPVVWVIPVDSARFHLNAEIATTLIDSLYQLSPKHSPEFSARFVFPDNFAEITYRGTEISYEDSVRYDIDNLEGDSLCVTVFDRRFTHVQFPKDSVGTPSPNNVKSFINRHFKRSV
ncbi:MAG: hypothetical protein K2L85_00765 [Paramuribaculum sp.]|nr:hypothetical protein [Paramuribaculum sp.]